MFILLKFAYLFALVHILWHVYYIKLDLKLVLVVDKFVRLFISSHLLVSKLVHLEIVSAAKDEQWASAVTAVASQGGFTKFKLCCSSLFSFFINDYRNW